MSQGLVLCVTPQNFVYEIPKRRDADPSPISSAEVKNRVELYLYSP